jgi:hypothetical protein
MSGHKDFHIRIPTEVHNRLKLIAAERGIAQRSIMVSAIKEFIGLDDDKEQEKQLAEQSRRDIYELKLQVSSLREDIEIIGELLSFYIYHWIGYTPRLSKEERAGLAVEAKERHERFMTLFARKLSGGELSLGALLAKGVSRDDSDPQIQESDHRSDTVRHPVGGAP